MKGKRPTPSEALFDEFCERAGLRWASILEGDEPSPDRRVWFGGHEVVVEVSSMDPKGWRETDAEIAAAFERGESHGMNVDPGPLSRVVERKGRRQLRISHQNGLPTLLVVHDPSRYSLFDSPHQLDHIFGQPGYTWTSGRDDVRFERRGDARFRSDRDLPSGVAVMRKERAGASLEVVRNPWATHRLDLTWFEGLAVSFHCPPGSSNPY